jgi:hypothetical protein
MIKVRSVVGGRWQEGRTDGRVWAAITPITAKIRFTVCRCLRGAFRSVRRISSMIGLNWSSFGGRGPAVGHDAP